LRYLLGQKTLEVNFRNQGIGSQLLATIIAYAKSKRLKRIEGQMVEKDLEPNPKLPQWYENRGFSVSKNELFIDLVKAPADDTRYMPKS
jgi:GNAT superfamily N-acetyltransferase